MTALKDAAIRQALEYLDAPSAKLWPAGTQHRIITALRAALAEPVQEPVGCSNTFSCRCPKHYTAPPQRLPLTEEMTKQMRERCASMEMRSAFVDGWLSAEQAHGIKEGK